MTGYIFAFVIKILDLLSFAIVINVLLSWIPQARGSKFAAALAMITEPILAPIRQMLNKAFAGKNMMIDFSPLIAILLIGMVQSLLQKLW